MVERMSKDVSVSALFYVYVVGLFSAFYFEIKSRTREIGRLENEFGFVVGSLNNSQR